MVLAMARYILRYAKAAAAPAAHVQSIKATDGIRMLDKSPNMLLVDADEGTLRKKLGELQGWSLSAEKRFPCRIPDKDSVSPQFGGLSALEDDLFAPLLAGFSLEPLRRRARR